MRLQKLLVVLLVVGVLGAGAVAYAAGASTPAEIVADLTDQSVESVQSQRRAGSSYGALAEEAGMLAEFKEQVLGLKKERLDQRVKDGHLTEEEAAGIYARMQTQQSHCNSAEGKGHGFGGRRKMMGLGEKANGSRPGHGFGHGMKMQEGFGR